MFKKFLIAVVVGLMFTAGYAVGGQLEDWFTRNMITPILQNYATSGLPTVGVRGKLAWDSTLGTATVDDGDSWAPIMTRELARLASHIELDGTAPTVSSCGSGSVGSGSTDTAGRVSNTGTSCIVTFANPYLNTPFYVVSGSTPYSQTVRAESFTTGIDVYGLTSGQAFSYVGMGQY